MPGAWQASSGGARVACAVRGVYDPGYDPVPEKMFFRYRIKIPN